MPNCWNITFPVKTKKIKTAVPPSMRGFQAFNRINPIGTYVLSHGGKMKNGQNVAKMAKYCNTVGNFLAADISDDNQKVPTYDKTAYANAKKNQSAIMFLPDVAAVKSCLRGGLSVALGNAKAVSGSIVDVNGMPVATLRGRWAHATHLTSSVKVKGTEYFGWLNSHGKIYKKGVFNEPGDGAYFTNDVLDEFLQGIWDQYGQPVAVFAEGRK
jgi:hypothetical protein